MSLGVYRAPSASARPRRRIPLAASESARMSRIRRQSAGFVNRGLNRAAGVDPEACGSTGRPEGDGSRCSMSGAGRGSSGSVAGESSISGSVGSAAAGSAGVSGDSRRVTGSPEMILVIRMPGGTLNGVREPGRSGAVPAFGLVAAGGAIPREKTSAWIAMEAAMEATRIRRLSLRRASAVAVAHRREARITLVRSGFRGVTACRSSSGTMLARGPRPNRLPHAFGNDVTRSVVRRLPAGDALSGRRMRLSSARRTGCRSRPRSPGAG